jgi:hypothetical protein
MSSSKILTCKGTLRQVFIRVYRLEIQSIMLVFSTQLCELLPLYPSLWFTSPLPCVHILQEFNTLYLTRFRIYKTVKPPQTKT